MGKFEDSIPQKLLDIDKALNALYSERRNINWGHECDCEFCEASGEDADPMADEKAAEIDKQIAEVARSGNRLIKHARDHGVNIDIERKKFNVPKYSA